MTIEEMKKAVEARLPSERKIRTDDGEYTEKLSFTFDMISKAAEELYQQTLLFDEETQCLYDLYAKEVVELYVFAKYFTDIDVSEVNTIEDKVVLFDYLFPCVGRSCFMNEGMDLVRKMADRMMESAKALYWGRTSIVNKISVMAKDMAINEDWISEFAKSREVNQEMIEMLGEHQKNKEREAKGKPTIGGNLVGLDRFGKKG